MNLNERLKQAKEDRDTIDENIADLERQIEESQVFRPGDKFYFKDMPEMVGILIVVGPNQVGMFYPENHCLWDYHKGPVTVEHVYRVTMTEIKKLADWRPVNES